MVEPPPPEDGVEPESRDHGEVEDMDVELALTTHAMPSGDEEGEVHSDGESHLEAVVQLLLSTNAVESIAGRNEQARGRAVAPLHAVPLDDGADRDVQARGAAIRT